MPKVSEMCLYCSAYAYSSSICMHGNTLTPVCSLSYLYSKPSSPDFFPQLEESLAECLKDFHSLSQAVIISWQFSYCR